jgi:hypothetical protein
MQFVEQSHIVLLKFVQWYFPKVLKFLLYGCQTTSAAMAVIEESVIQIEQNSFRFIRRLSLEHFHEPLVADWEGKISHNPRDIEKFWSTASVSRAYRRETHQEMNYQDVWKDLSILHIVIKEEK